MKSMTGYGFSNWKNNKATVDITIKSVNGRYLDIRTSLPQEYYKFESDIKKTIAEKFSRGSVSIFISRKKNYEAGELNVIHNKVLAKKWLSKYKLLGKELKLATGSPLDLMAKVPEILSVSEETLISEAEKKQIINCLQKSLQNCEKERVREGASIAKQILEFLKKLDEHTKTIKGLSKFTEKELRNKFKKKLKKLGLKEDLDPQRMAQEIVIQLDKLDNNEELQRIDEHLKVMKSLLGGADIVGKKLDFYTQELFREVNTVGSKSQLAKVTQCVVESKAIIERIREQVQNIE